MKFPYFSARPNRLNKLFIKASFYEPVLREKDKNSRGQKRPINFSYFLTRPNRLNKLFIKASSYEPTLRKKDEISR